MENKYSGSEAPASNLSPLQGDKERGGQTARGRDDRSPGGINSSMEAPELNLSLLPGDFRTIGSVSDWLYRTCPVDKS